MSISVAKAAFLGLFFETLLYGVFFTLYWLTLFVLFKKTGIQRRLLIPVATLLLCVATAHLIIDFVRGLEAFIFQVDTIGANAYYSDIASPLNLALISLYATQTILADGVLIWRVYALNNRSRFIAIPGCIVLSATAALGYYVVWPFSRTSLLSNISAATSGCIATFYTLTMFTSATCTTLIAWRIYRNSRVIPGGLGTFLPVFIVIIESGPLYTMCVLALLSTFLIGSNGQYIILGVIIPTVGIIFCLIILQVHFNVGGRPPTEQPAQMRSIRFRGRGVRDVDSSREPMTMLTMQESEIVQSDIMGRKNGQPLSGGFFQL
ncbi:uncharacterized protein EDB91DRAFT_298723 [Suillus paluster]|uniref:uncharacterized protein n=1 Tax=Suillus paluster TaxID=48578 RepID=UPI001B872DC7|nr:uncharacterized protein EDB91DRAFT_298723 [Suillus paluster]KAG1742797.1 hypothetical protein EDB91DRAFT_298723 [Suillus paluster]